MKSRIPILISAALFTSGCEKKEEPKPANVVTAPPGPQIQQPARRTPVTPQAATDSPAPSGEGLQAPSEEEIQTFLADLDKLAQEVAKLPKDTALTPEVDALLDTYMAIIQRRGALMARSHEEQKKELTLGMGPSARAIGPVMIRMRMMKARERAKNIAPKSGPALDSFIPELNAPPAKPPAPPQ